MALHRWPLVSVRENVREPVGLKPVDSWIHLYVLLDAVGKPSDLDIAVMGDTVGS